MDELMDILRVEDKVLWEQSYRDFVWTRKASIDEWLWAWLVCRIQQHNEEYSLFYNASLIDVNFDRVHIKLDSGQENKRRFIELSIFIENPYHPSYRERATVSEAEWRFPGVGNPFIDEPNYKIWEQLLMGKLTAELFIERGGLDYIIEQFSRYMAPH